MTVSTPSSAGALAEQLKAASLAHRSISLVGNNSKHLASGPIVPSDIQISTRALNRVLVHERNDLTISVEAGMRLCDLQTFLQPHEQMIALDPPFFSACTVGGVLATDYGGPLRRKFGTARDQVIGMSFARLDGTIVKAGGMVVKNVAGLDLAKVLIGSFGTLAAITSVNLRVHSLPQDIRTFLLSFASIATALEARSHILQSALTPWAVELFSPLAAARLGRRRVLLAIRVAGSAAVLERYRAQLKPEEELTRGEDSEFWRATSNFTSDFLSRNPNGVVVRIATPLSDIGSVFNINSSCCCVSHAGSGVTDAFFTSWQPVVPLWNLAREKQWNAVVAFAPSSIREEQELWSRPSSPEAGNGFDMMGKLKKMFDPSNLLNRSRLYGRL